MIDITFRRQQHMVQLLEEVTICSSAIHAIQTQRAITEATAPLRFKEEFWVRTHYVIRQLFKSQKLKCFKLRPQEWNNPFKFQRQRKARKRRNFNNNPVYGAEHMPEKNSKQIKNEGKHENVCVQNQSWMHHRHHPLNISYSAVCAQKETSVFHQ
jgi:hypothetical protein